MASLLFIIHKVRGREATENEWLFGGGPIQELKLESEVEIGDVGIDEATFEELLPQGYAERGLRSTIDVQTIEGCIHWADRLSGTKDDRAALDVIRHYILFDAYPETLNSPDPPPADEILRRLDRDFCDKLGPEDTTNPCRRDGCGRGRVSFSVFCRQHQFENVRKRP